MTPFAEKLKAALESQKPARAEEPLWGLVAAAKDRSRLTATVIEISQADHNRGMPTLVEVNGKRCRMLHSKALYREIIKTLIQYGVRDYNAVIGSTITVERDANALGHGLRYRFHLKAASNAA